MIDMPALPHNLPWELNAYVLLDGVRLPDLAKQLYQWPNRHDGLYVTTRWHELLDISPYLVALTGPNDPVLGFFLRNAGLEPGYLLFTQADSQTLSTYLRSLLTVQYPSGDEVMMRVADPAVMHQLITASADTSSARWFGPIEQVCLPDSTQGLWHEHKRPADTGEAEPSTLRITDQELTALGEVEFQRYVLRLTAHLNTYFPDLMAPLSVREQRGYAQRVAQEAYDKGFYSAQEVTLYANVLAYLGDEPVASHPKIDYLLNHKSAFSALVRVQWAAEMAERLSLAAQEASQ